MCESISKIPSMFTIAKNKNADKANLPILTILYSQSKKTRKDYYFLPGLFTHNSFCTYIIDKSSLLTNFSIIFVIPLDTLEDISKWFFFSSIDFMKETNSYRIPSPSNW